MHQKAFGLLLGLLLIAFPVLGDNREPPRSWQLASSKAQPVVATIGVPGIDALATRKDDLSSSKPGAPLQFAERRRVGIDMLQQADRSLLDGHWVARLRIAAKGATDLNFRFSNVSLGEQARLHIYDAEHGVFQGPLRLSSSQKATRSLWTPVVPTGNAVIELSWPQGSKQPQLEIADVWVGYRDLFGYYGGPFLRPKQGLCNIDVICPEGDPWRDEIRSVATYSYGGATLCTGTLVNDATSSLTPYFLTAHHCNVTAGNASSMVVYWNFESATCGDLGGGSLSQNQTGASLKASREDVDMALVELDTTPSESFNVHYAGWDRSGEAPEGTVGIHHPSTDEKAISFSNQQLTAGKKCTDPGAEDTHWIVPQWDIGTTEPGSSGSGIWHPTRKRLIGFLTGGSASCSNTSGLDCYGRFDVAWDGPDSTSRLRDWLDPDGVSPVTGVDGTDPTGFSLAADPANIEQCTDADASYTISVAGNGGFSDPVTLTVSGEPGGASTGFSANPVAPGGSSTLTIGNLAGVASGSSALTVSGNGGGQTEQVLVGLTLLDGAPGAATSISAPADGATGVSTQPTIRWAAVSGATSYRVQVAADGNFASPLVDTTTSNLELTLGTALQANTSYGVRVMASNSCGDANWSSVVSFTTAALYCSSPATAIPDDNASGITDTISVVETGALSDLDLSINLDHSYIGDLIIRLTHVATGTTVDILNQPTCNGDNIDTRIDDEAGFSLQNDCQGSATAYPESRYTPLGSLTDVDGEDLSGDWTLFVSDNFAVDTGTLQQWCLIPTIDGGSDPGDVIFSDRFEVNPVRQ